MTKMTDYLLQLREAMQRNQPELLALFEPRRICSPPQYHSSKIVAPLLLSTAGQFRQDEQGPPSLRRTGVSVVNSILKCGVPVYCVVEPFARAVAATELPDDFTLADLHWPMPGFVAGFPSAFMREYCGLDTSYVLCADLAAGDYAPPSLLRGILPTTCVPKAKAAFQFFHWNQTLDRLESFVGAYEKEHRVNEALSKYAYVDYTGLDADGVKSAEERLSVLVNLMFKMLVVLNTRGDLIEPPVCLRAAKIKRGRPREALWSPALIGHRYRVQRETPTGSHASPRVHWRRGHLTFQVMGRRENLVPIATLPRMADGTIDWDVVEVATREKFWKSHRRLWVEPVLVGLK